MGKDPFRVLLRPCHRQRARVARSILGGGNRVRRFAEARREREGWEAMVVTLEEFRRRQESVLAVILHFHLLPPPCRRPERRQCA